ncbi:hypothetical protein EMQ25_08905 [Arsenicitalea aurantiaca]|uniref:Uncharacterized protein n=1 Tax=Arsenicitalea aurantiaca TaxID=1783274 RepID=A0A433XA91_9HYPH|nr:glycoside hydrolase family 108 protein [Arsenicitalea aurantiaca]RUT30989.1 hypothetical protein EMQ25_08905 [Arsenicitalea aurantiaca]
MVEERRFAACLNEVLGHEGGYVDHPSDPGGATNMGITRATLAAWRGVSPVTALPKAEVRSLGRAEAEAIYRALYWDRCRGEMLPAGVDLAIFDFAVNSGADRAIRALQGALGVSRDGIIGPVTLGALEAGVAAGGTAALIGTLCDGRLGFLKALRTFAIFGRGWSNRVEAVRSAALAMARAAGLADTGSTGTERTIGMDFLQGYKTYIVALAMLLAGVAQMLGVELPSFSGQSAGHLVMEAFALIFLRSGLKASLAR